MRWWPLLLLIALAGCKKAIPPIVPVSGVVLLDGQPLGKAEIRFYPMEDSIPGDYIGTAVTDDEGKFTLSTNNQPGACACLNHVIVYEGPPPEADMRTNPSKWDRYIATLKNRPIPPQYGTLASSPIKITVKADQAEYKIELKR